jgi:hypothetical protein
VTVYYSRVDARAKNKDGEKYEDREKYDPSLYVSIAGFPFWHFFPFFIFQGGGHERTPLGHRPLFGPTPLYQYPVLGLAAVRVLPASTALGNGGLSKLLPCAQAARLHALQL